MSTTTLSSNTESSNDIDDVFNVVLRIRPLNSQEKGRRDQSVVECPGDGQVSVNNSGTNRNFKFNVVFESDTDQEQVFEKCGIKKLVEAALNGFTCTAFAFGQTGSGKTHTMTGPPAQFHKESMTVPDQNMFGIIQRSFKYLYQEMNKQGPHKNIRASYLEIYNEQVIDLLNNSHGRYLSVRWSKNKGFYVENLFNVPCETIDDLMAVLEEGLRNRQTGSHGLNEFSSRSHSVLTVTIESETQPEPEDDTLYVTSRGKLSFVDLAGSEKVKDYTAPGPGMVESNSINKSLLVLGNCISHLGDSKRRLGHIPYRDSKLTKLLSDSLAGNGITLMVACITPSSANITETLNTLRYASRAKKIKTRPTVAVDPRETLIVTLKREIRILRQENHYLRLQLDFPVKPKGHLQKENDEQFVKFMKQQQQKEDGMYEMLQEYMVENESLRVENSNMHTIKDSMRREHQMIHRENERLARRVEDLERLISQQASAWSVSNHHRPPDGYNQWDRSPWVSTSTADYTSPFHRPAVKIMSNDYPIGREIMQESFTVSQNQPIRHPRRIVDHVTRPSIRPIEYTSSNGYTVKQISPRRTSQVKPDLNRDINETLMREVIQLDGEIAQHTRTAHASKAASKDVYR